jgi:hypothetical protein
MREASKQAIAAAIGKVISRIEFSEGDLDIFFADGSRLYIVDDGHQCSESRYMTCDDDVSIHEGAKLVFVETRDVSDDYDVEEDKGWDDVHDVEFLVVQTTKGVLTVATHNEHNGYYGGFSITAKLHPPRN